MKFETKDYYLTSTCYLPGLFTPNSTRNISYDVNGNGAWIYDHSSVSTPIDYFATPFPTLSVAEAWQRRRFNIYNFSFNGQGAIATGSGKAMILLGESYNSTIHHNHFEYCDIAVKNRFSMNTEISYNNAVNYTGDAFVVTYGSDYGGDWSNSASNHVRLFKNRMYGNANSGKGVYIRGASGCIVDDCIWEGDGSTDLAGTHAVYFDGDGATTVKECTIKSFHIERKHVTGGAFFYIRGTTGMFTIEKPYIQKVGTFVHAAAYSGGYPEIKISGIGFIPNGCKLRSNSTACWIIEHNILAAVYGITSDTTMRTGVNASDNSTIWYSGYKSTTSNTVGTGSKTFTIPINAVGYTAGDTIRIEAFGSSAFMTGTVTSYTPATGVLVANITASGGSGTLTDWRMWTNDSCPPTAGRIIYFGSNNQGG
jgi:hypothetical protein